MLDRRRVGHRAEQRLAALDWFELQQLVLKRRRLDAVDLVEVEDGVGTDPPDRPPLGGLLVLDHQTLPEHHHAAALAAADVAARALGASVGEPEGRAVAPGLLGQLGEQLVDPAVGPGARVVALHPEVAPGTPPGHRPTFERIEDPLGDLPVDVALRSLRSANVLGHGGLLGSRPRPLRDRGRPSAPQRAPQCGRLSVPRGRGERTGARGYANIRSP